MAHKAISFEWYWTNAACDHVFITTMYYLNISSGYVIDEYCSSFFINKERRKIFTNALETNTLHSKW